MVLNMMIYEYPGSRASMSRDCKICRTGHGVYKNRNVLTLRGSTGEDVKLLQLSCDYCGHTLLFDLSAVKKRSYQGDGEERIPNFEATLS